MKKLLFWSIIGTLYGCMYAITNENTLPVMVIAVPYHQEQQALSTKPQDGYFQDVLYKQALAVKLEELVTLLKEIAQVKAQRFTQKHLIPLVNTLGEQFQDYYTDAVDTLLRDEHDTQSTPILSLEDSSDVQEHGEDTMSSTAQATDYENTYHAV